MTFSTEYAVETTREALAHAERHGFDFPAEIGHRVFVGENGVATLRVDDENLARLTVLSLSPLVGGRPTEATAQLSDYSGPHADADLLDWVEEHLFHAKRIVT